MTNKKAIAIDGNSLMYRCFYATYNQLEYYQKHNLKPMNAFNLFVYSILKLINANHYDYAVIAFDHGKTTFRTEKYEKYKEGRKPMPDGLVSQLEDIKNSAKLMGIIGMELPRYEADDIIGSFANLMNKNNVEVEIYSSDRDMLQLVNNLTKVMMFKYGVSVTDEYNTTNFKDKFMIYPPSVREVVADDQFGYYITLFTHTQEALDDDYLKQNQNRNPLDPIVVPTAFQFLLYLYNDDEEMRRLIIDGFKFFIHQSITVLDDLGVILIGELKENIINASSIDDLILLEEEDYFEFQQYIRAVLGIKLVEEYDPNMHWKVREMKAKARERDRVKAKQAAKKGTGLTLAANLVAICCMGIGLNPLNIGEISYASVGWLTNTYQRQERYDIDIRSLIGGADRKKVHPEYWIQNLN